MENWYAMKTMSEKEEEAAELIRRTLPPSLWESCTILRKKKLFRADGKLILSMEKMFPGYLFLQTDRIQDVSEMLKRSREYPHLLGEGGGQAVRMEEKDLAFLKQVCGEQLDQPMGLSQVEAVCAGRGGTLWKTGNRFIWDLSARRSDLGREKINTAETLSTTVKTAGGRLR